MRHQLPPCSSGVYWEVASGDTLFKIAQAVGVTLDEIIAANPNIEPESLQIGQPVCIPEGGTHLPNLKSLPKCPGGIYWQIAPGDTLFKIAQLNRISVRKIIAANPGINPNSLKTGQFICLPG